MAKTDPLKPYKAKRNFSVTAEPSDGGTANDAARSFVVQKHWASRLHYDFRLELDGTMKSWAVPKGPSFDSADKRMAVHVEDHPISYNSFEGEIPAGQYGAGKVIIWDKGTWMPIGDAGQGYRQGKLKFELVGHKLRGRWALVRMKGKNEKQDPWLLIKEKDEYARPADEFSVIDEMPDSVIVESTGRAASLPATLKPQLATLVDKPPSDSGEWLYEIKFDGYRLLARVQKNDIRLYTRNGNDWTDRLPALADELAKLKVPDGWYDGEIVVADAHGLPDFQALQGAFDKARTKDILYYLFDIPFFDGADLRGVALIDRRQKLQQLMAGVDSKLVRFSDTFDGAAGDIVDSACRLGLEGVIGKRKMSHYVSRRSADWIKLKCSLRQEFVIGGYTDPQGSRAGIGSLLLGVHDATGALLYAGNVGTGFSDKTLTSIRKKLDVLHTKKNPFSSSTGIDRKAHWVEPRLLAEVSFGQWTNTGHIRHSVFHGLRSDKPATHIIRETSMPTSTSESRSKRASASSAAPAASTSASTSAARSASASGRDISPLSKLKITNADRVVDKSTKLTKLDVVRHYALVAPLMLEHLKGRPVSLVRAPAGVNEPVFFQKHLETGKLVGVRSLPAELDPDHEPLIEIASAQGLLNAAQMNVLEFHTWNATKTSIGKPDRMTFDLDPGKGVEWPAMQEAALVVRSLLQELELASFVKTSGGKGLHVVVPLKRLQGWDTVKDFSHAIVLHLAKTLPARYSAKSGPKNRVGKIFIDYLRNGFGATTVAAWSARARPGMGVSVPIGWDEVDLLRSSAQWHIGNIHERLDRGNDPWNDYNGAAQALGPAMKILGFKPAK